jgi:hypothetical protein
MAKDKAAKRLAVELAMLLAYETMGVKAAIPMQRARVTFAKVEYEAL